MSVVGRMVYGEGNYCFVDVLCELWVEWYKVKVINLFLIQENTMECITIILRYLQLNVILQSMSISEFTLKSASQFVSR